MGCSRYVPLVVAAAALTACGRGQSAPAQQHQIENSVTGAHVEDVDAARQPVERLLGTRATIFLCWTLSCPCVNQCLAQLKQRIGEYKGVNVVCVSSDPADHRSVVTARVRTFPFQSPFYFVFDDAGRLLRTFGFRRAGQVAVVDSRGRVRYAGTLANAYADPTGYPAFDAVEAVLADGTVPVAWFDAGYGCPLSTLVADLAPQGSENE